MNFLSRLEAYRLILRRRRALRIGPPNFSSVDQILEWHFGMFSTPDHVNRVGLSTALRGLNQGPALILETGTSAHGTDSTRLFATYVNTFGGHLFSVDISPEPRRRLGDLGERVDLCVEDSVSFLQNFVLPNAYQQSSLVYLDSFDLDLADPYPSMLHGLREWQAIQNLTGPGSIVVIDDTPIDGCLWSSTSSRSLPDRDDAPGKGRLVLDQLETQPEWMVRYHHYNVVLQRV